MAKGAAQGGEHEHVCHSATKVELIDARGGGGNRQNDETVEKQNVCGDCPLGLGVPSKFGRPLHQPKDYYITVL